VIPKLGHGACRIVSYIGVFEEGGLGVRRGGVGTLEISGAEIGELARVTLTAIRTFHPHCRL
jgi:hypothetical protein